MDAQSSKIDVLLMRYLYSSLVKNLNETEQMGLLYVGTYAANKGFKVRVQDGLDSTFDNVKEIVQRCEPKVIGFFVDHENVNSTMSVIDNLKSINKDLLCVAGGPQGSAIPWDERILSESQCDIVVRGEGELTFMEILDWFCRDKGSLKLIKGITYKESEEIKRNPERPPIQNLDLLPIPDRNLNFNSKPIGSISIITSRGCPYHCSFCYEGKRESAYRPRSIPNVLAEVEELLQTRHPVYITILDDTFTVNPERVLEFCQGMRELRQKYYDVAWFCEGRANFITKHPEIVPVMVEAGLIRMQIGVETGNQHILDAYNKNLRLEEIREAVRICGEADVLSIVGNFIVGGAHENRETAKTSIKFAEELLEIGKGRLELNTTIYTPYPGTPMYEQPEAFGLKVLDPDCETGPGNDYCFVETNELTKWEILHIRQMFIEAIGNKMLELIQDVPYELMCRHYQAYFHRGVRTHWYEASAHLANYYSYFSLLFRGDYTHWPAMPAGEMEKYKPVRTILIGSSYNGKLILDLQYKKLELNELTGFIFEHCYGRLSLKTIIDRVHQKYFPQDEREYVKNIILKLLEQLDAEKLCIFSKY